MNTEKKLFVCGSSWSSASIKTPGKHHGELLAAELGYDFVSLARGGISNAAICLQIEYAIKQQADFVLVSFAPTDRWDVPILADKKYADLEVNCNMGRYEIHKGLLNIHYNPSVDLSSTNDFLSPYPTILSHTFNTILDPDGTGTLLTKSQKTSIKMFIADLLDVNWKWQIDAWCADSCLRRLDDSGIKYLVHIDQLKLKENNFLPWMSASNYMNFDVSPYEVEIKEDPGYHTGLNEQEHMFKMIYQHIEKNFKL
jgi:hypothetical protein